MLRYRLYVDILVLHTTNTACKQRPLGNRICAIQRCVREPACTKTGGGGAELQVGCTRPYVRTDDNIILLEGVAMHGKRGRLKKKFISSTRRAS